MTDSQEITTNSDVSGSSTERDFKPFAQVVHTRFNEMQKHTRLFVADVSKDEIWDKYLASFPEGTNPIFRERTEHDCSCCRNFVKNIGNVVAIVDGTYDVLTVWDDIDDLPAPYDVVAQSLRDYVRDAGIKSLFLAGEPKYGAQVTREELSFGKIIRWNHFHGKIDKAHQRQASRQSLEGDYNTTVAMLRRAVLEVTPEAISTVQELIDNNSLYRGEEHRDAVRKFNTLFNKLSKCSDTEFDRALWVNANNTAARFRNTVIGTLVTDLSTGVDLETAVASFESKVAPTNYKRPKALITKKMVTDAMKTIESLGVRDSIERRYASIGDISVNNVLWVDNSVQHQMRDSLEESLMSSVAVVGKPATGKEIKITAQEFFDTVAPEAIAIDVKPKQSHVGNFMSLTAPVHPDAKSIFKWNNNFAWTYDGDITDSAIKERVRKAGGKVDGSILRTSLSWSNYDDLDIHVREAGGRHVYFSQKRGAYCTLDVDMNAGGKHSRSPVENIVFDRLPRGKTIIEVNQFAKREMRDVGFELEVEYAGGLMHYSHPADLKSGTVRCLEITSDGNQVTDVKVLSNSINGQEMSTEKWGVKTNEWQPVSTLMLSPNHWDGQSVGNRHWFFILKDAECPDSARGIYNEFLSPELEKHRKVFEVLGSKTRCEYTPDQLSGIGLSSTKKDEINVRVTTNQSVREYRVVTGE